jgi:conjugal transfer/entry exclusion protein
MFFRDEGEMGDVLDEAQKLLEATKQQAQALEENIQSEIEAVDDYREQVEGVRYRQVIKELVGEAIEDVKGVVAGLVNEWHAKKLQMKLREEEIAMQQQVILDAEKKIETRMTEFEVEQKERMSNELENITQLSANVTDQLEELEKTKNAIDTILVEDAEAIKDRLISKEDVEFLRLNYFSLLQARLANKGVVNPLTEEEYKTGDWKIGVEKEEIIAKITKGVIRKHTAVDFEIKFIVPEDEEGFIYRKLGKDVSDVITGFIQPTEGETDSFGALVLVSPTGWTEWVINKVEDIRNVNRSVYLVDLNDRKVIFNDSDKKTKLFADWFAPVSLEEAIADVITKIGEEIEGGVPQFRVDKVASKYQVPRKIVMGAFEELVEEGKGEIIMPEEGVKDVLLMVR